VSKIKINLTSGNVVEKPLVTCFKGTNGTYIVFDNETNGSMGLPIICISKFNGSSAEKIFDQSEWASVKENLKTIIAGTALPYVSVPESITAQDDFFTQLTLPVASFDLLKNVYKPIAPTVETSAVTAEPVVSPTPEVVQAAPLMEPAPIAQSEVIAPAPIMPAEPIAPLPPVVETPVVPNAPIIDTPVMAPMPETPVAPAVTNSESTTTSNSVSSDDIIAIKENFMKSCETMFDALIKKFENK